VSRRRPRDARRSGRGWAPREPSSPACRACRHRAGSRRSQAGCGPLVLRRTGRRRALPRPAGRARAACSRRVGGPVRAR
jgi:hypothetical protein